jgi:hypothetical protein
MDPGAFGNLDPRVTGKKDWIHGVSNHSEADSEVVLRDSVGDAIASIVEGVGRALGRPNNLFYRIDTQMNRTDLRGQFARNGRLAHAGQAAQDNERCVQIPS